MRITKFSRTRKSPKRSLHQRRKRLALPLLAAGMAGAVNNVYGDTSTTLTGLGATNAEVPANHGSNAEATLTWDAGWDQYADWNGRGDVYQVDQPVNSLMFAPASANIRITLNQFELDEWAGGGDTSANWMVTGSSSGMLASGIWNTFNAANDPNDAGGRSVVSANAMGALGETLTLKIDHTNLGVVSYLALDNLVYSTVFVPEPASGVLTWLGVSGLGAMAMRRARKGKRG